MLARTERQLIRASHRADTRSTIVPIRIVGGPAGIYRFDLTGLC